MQKCYTIILYILHLSLTYKQNISPVYMNSCVIAHIVNMYLDSLAFHPISFSWKAQGFINCMDLCDVTTKLNLSHTNKSCYSQDSLKKPILLQKSVCMYTPVYMHVYFVQV